MDACELRQMVRGIVRLKREAKGKRRLARQAWALGERKLSQQYAVQASDRFELADSLRERLRMR